MQLQVDLDRLSLGDIEFFEEYTGEGIEQLELVAAGERRATAKMLTALVFFSEKKKDAAFTIAQAREVSIGDIEWATDPTPEEVGAVASSETSPSSSRTSRASTKTPSTV